MPRLGVGTAHREGDKRMKHRKSAVMLLLAVLVFSLGGQAWAAALPRPTNEFYVNDFADVLSLDVEEHIVEIGNQLHAETTAQVVVVTVPSIGQEEIFTYSLALARDWGIGDAALNNGCLIFLSIEDRQSYVQVGYGLEGRLTDGRTGSLQDDYLIPYLKEGDYDGGVKNLYDAIVTEVYIEYEQMPPDNVTPVEPKEPFDWSLVVMGSVVVGLIVFATIDNHTGWTQSLNTGGSSSDNDSSSSSRGGGGSSSSGGSSGGGGSFGGGGSGRSW